MVLPAAPAHLESTAASPVPSTSLALGSSPYTGDYPVDPPSPSKAPLDDSVATQATCSAWPPSMQIVVAVAA